jgi:hypothetical protein
LPRDAVVLSLLLSNATAETREQKRRSGGLLGFLLVRSRSP